MLKHITYHAFDPNTEPDKIHACMQWIMESALDYYNKFFIFNSKKDFEYYFSLMGYTNEDICAVWKSRGFMLKPIGTEYPHVNFCRIRLKSVTGMELSKICNPLAIVYFNPTSTQIEFLKKHKSDTFDECLVMHDLTYLYRICNEINTEGGMNEIH